MLGRAVNLYFITKYKNISTRKPKYCRAAMRIKEFILYGLKKPYTLYISFIAIRKTSIRCTITPRIPSKNTTLANNCRVHIVYIQRIKVYMSYVIRH